LVVIKSSAGGQESTVWRPLPPIDPHVADLGGGFQRRDRKPPPIDIVLLIY
jgi:hypothetical protein